MIAIVDYGMGNLRSVHKAFVQVGHEAVVTRDPAVLDRSDRVVLPGVGAFPDCMANLERHGLIDPVLRAIRSGKPFLGICLGLQLLFAEGEEFGVHKGLGVFAGRVVRFPQSDLKVPHMGWNQVDIERRAVPFEGIEDGSYFYFVHSYVVRPEEEGIVSSTTVYGEPFVSSIWKENVFACQFHPEKSQAVGLKILKNFGEWRCA